MRDGEVNLKTTWAIAFIAIAVNICAAQTPIDVPDNTQDDIRLGRKAAVKIEKQLPLVSEPGFADNHIENVGGRLVRAIPSRYRHRGFVYRFEVVNVRDINAFALSGGPLYVNRVLIEAFLTMAPAPSKQQATLRGN